MIYQVLLSFIGLAYSYGFPIDQYYNDPRGTIERQYIQELPTQTFYYYPVNRIHRKDYNIPQQPGGFVHNPEYHRKDFNVPQQPSYAHNPDYHKLLFNYVPNQPGNQQPIILPAQTGFFEVLPPAQETVPMAPVAPVDPAGTPAQGGISQKVEEFDTDVPKPDNEISVDKETEDQNVDTKEETTEGSVKPGLDEHLLPSDFILLSNDPRSQFYGNFDAIKLRKMKFKANPTTLPPLGGRISNYILLKDHPDYVNQFPFARNMPDSNVLPVKRQVYDSFEEGIVINADGSQSLKKSELNKQEPTGDKEEDKEEEQEQPAVAQSKPSAIALAGPGGVAQASPVGTALVGPGGLAISAPSGTAVAGPAGQGAVQIANPDEKVKLAENNKGNKEENKKPSSDPQYY